MRVSYLSTNPSHLNNCLHVCSCSCLDACMLLCLYMNTAWITFILGNDNAEMCPPVTAGVNCYCWIVLSLCSPVVSCQRRNGCSFKMNTLYGHNTCGKRAFIINSAGLCKWHLEMLFYDSIPTNTNRWNVHAGWAEVIHHSTDGVRGVWMWSAQIAERKFCSLPHRPLCQSSIFSLNK